MKPIKCEEMESSIAKLAMLEIDPNVPVVMMSHMDQCLPCQKKYAHLRPTLLSEKQSQVPEIDESFWKKLPASVLAQVNDLKTDIGASMQTEPAIDMAAYRRNLDSFDNRIVPSASVTRPVVVMKSTRAKVILPIAASILMVVAVILVIQMPATTMQAELQPQFKHSSAEFQSLLSSKATLPNLVKQFEIKNEPVAMFSFAAQSKSTSGFVVGSYYAESLAMLDGSDAGASYAHLRSLQAKMSATGSAGNVNRSLQNALDELSVVNASKKDHVKAMSKFSTNYTSFLDEYTPNDLVYYQLGQWTVNMALAAASKSELVRQETAHLDYFINTLSAQSALRGVINALKEMRALIEQPQQSIIDSEKILSLNLKIRKLLV